MPTEELAAFARLKRLGSTPYFLFGCDDKSGHGKGACEENDRPQCNENAHRRFRGAFFSRP